MAITMLAIWPIMPLKGMQMIHQAMPIMVQSNGGAVWTATGKVGGALDFDGVDDYVDIGDIDLTDSFTIAAWMKLSSTGKYTIVGKSYSTYQFYCVIDRKPCFSQKLK